MLSLTCKIAIKAVVYLGASYESGEKSSMKAIAADIDASEHTVGKLLQVLVKEGVISSLKGPTGGFFITAKQMKQPILNIVEAIDGKEVFKECGLGFAKCSDAHPCPLHRDYKDVRDRFLQLCKSRTIHDLCDTVNEGQAFLM